MIRFASPPTLGTSPRRLLPLYAAVALLVAAAPSTAQMPRQPDAVPPLGWVGGPGSANYELASRWAPYKLDDLVHSTSVSPRWIEGSESFWYEYETSEGSFHWIVDPVAGTKRAVFDRDRIAAEITRITGDPYDARHLPIRSIRFVDAGRLRFEVESSQDEEVEEEADSTDVQEDEQEEERRPAPAPARRSTTSSTTWRVAPSPSSTRPSTPTTTRRGRACRPTAARWSSAATTTSG